MSHNDDITAHCAGGVGEKSRDKSSRSSSKKKKKGSNNSNKGDKEEQVEISAKEELSMLARKLGETCECLSLSLYL